MIRVHINDADFKTCEKFAKEAVILAYLRDNKIVKEEEIELVLSISNAPTVRKKRCQETYSRSLIVEENGIVKYVIGYTNTNFDYDRLDEPGYIMGGNNYHGNTYLLQGINNIFDTYVTIKNKYNSSVKLFFYLLDTQKSYSYNAYNLFNYKKLQYLGYDILNFSDIKIDKIRNISLYTDVLNKKSYSSISSFINDMFSVSNSSRNNSNNSSYILRNSDTDTYCYYVKGLAANAYDSFLNILVLQTLCKNLNLKLCLKGISEKAKRDDVGNGKVFELPKKIKELLCYFNSNIEMVTEEEVITDINTFFVNNYIKSIKEKDIRNQGLFKNNMLRKQIPIKCACCGIESDVLLEGAHIFAVSDINSLSDEEVERIYNSLELSTNDLALVKKLCNNENEIFIKKSTLACIGDNGIYLCKNCHSYFDNNILLVDEESGNLKLNEDIVSENDKEIINSNIKTDIIPKFLLTKNRKIFINERNLRIKQENK